MKNQAQKKDDNKKAKQETQSQKTKTNTYTPQENQFADGKGSKLDDAIDGDALNPATRGE